ncbi:MAG: hypothetical protein LCH34_02405 [Firmicutes bacterium]|nr:hypothetical protein [Bacillota bacterium]
MKKWGMLLLMLGLLVGILALSGCSNGGDTEANTEATIDQTTLAEETTAGAVEAEATEETVFDPGKDLPPVDSEEFVGYWRMVERNENGEVKDVSDYPIYFLEVTENRLYIITTSLNENEGYSSADKFYVLDGAYCYYDYDEINQDNYKNAIDSPWGGRYVVSFDDEDQLVLTEYYSLAGLNDAYNTYTYVKIPANEWPISD